MYNVVIVEDEALEREALQAILQRHVTGIRIVGAARNGTEALGLIEDFDIDLMLVDINIPKPNGLAVIKRLREKRAETKVIIITAYDNTDIMRSAIHLKADEYLLKPIRSEHLVEAVETCLHQLGSGRRNEEIVDRLGRLMERHDYVEAASVLRRHLEWIYGQREEAPRQLIVEFADGLVDMVGRKGLRLPDGLRAKAEKLQTMQLTDGSRMHVQGVFRDMMDVLFDTAEERFGRSPERVQSVLNYIERNLRTGVTLESAAEHANVSVSYLSRLFKKAMGVNFITYLTRRRIDVAKELLTTSDQPITNIAMDLSYSDVNYFCKSFKKEVGVSPSTYRREHRPSHEAA